MHVQETAIEGLKIITPRVVEDERGYFFESYRQDQFNKYVEEVHFCQDNQSLSKKNVLRGLHFQHPPYEQGKLVRVVAGSALDVAVDIRKQSATLGQHVAVVLSAENKKTFWIPPGFAHGFLSLSDGTLLSYKCTQFYHAESEDALLWNDPDLNIDWRVDVPLVSEKDARARAFKNFESTF